MKKQSGLVSHEEISLGQLPLGTIFKIGFLSNIFVWGTSGAIYGVLAIFGRNTVSVGGEYMHGIGGFFSSLLIAALMSALGASVLAIGGFIAGRATGSARFARLIYTVSSAQARKKAAEARRQVLQELEAEKAQKSIPEGRLW